MSVYVDTLNRVGTDSAPRCFQGKESCHMYADTPAELHALAAKIGLRPEWFQGHRIDFPHYDLTTLRRAHAVKLGAIETDRYHLIGFVHKQRGLA